MRVWSELRKSADDAMSLANDYDWPRNEMLALPPFYVSRVYLAKANPAAILELLSDLSASLELLREYRENHRRHIDFNTRCTPEGRVEAYPIICDLCKKADQLLGVEGV